MDANPATEGRYIIAATSVKVPIDKTHAGVQLALYDPISPTNPTGCDREEARYTSHFETCPNAGRHSKKAKR